MSTVSPFSHTSIRRAGGILALAAVFTSAATAHAAYTFNKIVDDTTAVPGGGTFAGFGLPALSGDTIAFNAGYTGGVAGTRGIFSARNGVVTAIVRSGTGTPAIAPGGGTFSSLGNPTISGNTTAFVSDYTGGTGTTGVFSITDGVLTSVARNTPNSAPGGGNFLFFDDPAVSGSNTTFIGYSNGTGGSRGIYTGNGGALTTIVRAGDATPLGGKTTFTDFGNPTIKGNTVAFSGTFGGVTATSGVFTSTGGVLTTVATNVVGGAPGGSFFSSFSNPAVNGNTVAFRGGDYTETSGAWGIYTVTGGQITTAATGAKGGALRGGTFTYFTPPLLVGDAPVFYADYSNGGSIFGGGLFTSLSGVLTPIIQLGDSLFGSTVTRVSAILPQDSDGNTLGFTYTLANGRNGIATTTLASVAVPEAGAGTLAAFAFPALGMIGLARRRR